MSDPRPDPPRQARPRIEEIGVVIVSWRDEEELLQSVASLARARRCVAPGGPRTSLSIVVNGPSALDAGAIGKLWPDARVTFNPGNRGFGPAANQAAALAGSPDALLFVNPDARAEGDPFTSLARGFDEHADAVALAPRLLDVSEPDGDLPGARPLRPPGLEDQFTFQLRRLPTLASDARELLLWDHALPDGRARRRFRYADADRSSVFEVEQAAAAALAVRADAFRTVGGFDERFVPAWFEDVDLCARLRRVGRILYWPGARFRHRGGLSSDRLGYMRFLPLFYANAVRYRAIHYGRGSRVLYRGLLALGMLLRLAALPFRPPPPRLRSEAARAYLGALRVALVGPAAPRGLADTGQTE